MARMVSAVIPTVNRPQAVVDLVRDLQDQEYPSFEIIVVDQGQEMNRELQEASKRDHRLRVVRTDVVGTCHARNLGVRNATGEIIVFLDDDCRVERKDYLAVHVRAYDDPQIGGVGGRVIDKNLTLNREQCGPICTVTKTGRVYPNASGTERQFINAPRGGNMSFRKSVIEAVGGFDEHFRGNAMREETDFSLRVVKAGWKILFEPEAENIHLGLPAGTRAVDRIQWYQDFFFNELYFFLKHFPKRYLPLLFLRKLRPILACIGYYGRFQPRAILTPFRGFSQALRAYREGSAGNVQSRTTRSGRWILLATLFYVLVSAGAIGYFGLLALPFVVMGALSAVAIWFIVREPIIGIILIAFFLPFERIGSLDIGGFTLRISQVLLAVTLLIYLFQAVQRRLSTRPYPIFAPLTLFLAANLLSFSQAANLSRAVSVFSFILFTASLSFLIVQLVRREDHLRRVLIALLLTAGIVSVFGIFQFIGDLINLPPSITGLRDLYTKEVFGFPRVHSTALEPLYFGNFLLIPIAFALTFLFSKTSPFRWFVLLPLLGLFLANLVLTLSRGAYVGAAVLFLIVLGLSVKRVFSPVRLAALIVIFVGVYLAVTRVFGLTGDVNFFLGRFSQQALDLFSGAAFGDREQTFSAAWQAFLGSPIFGIGTGNFGPLVAVQPLVTPERGWLIVNNVYLEVLAESGLLGFLSFLSLLFVLIVRSVKALVVPADPRLRAYLVASIAAFVGIFVQYGTFSILYIMHVWFAIGLLVAAQNLLITDTQPRPRSSMIAGRPPS